MFVKIYSTSQLIRKRTDDGILLLDDIPKILERYSKETTYDIMIFQITYETKESSDRAGRSREFEIGFAELIY